MTAPEVQFKKAVVALLDKEGREHREQHQPNKANRYTISAVGGYSVEIMFEKGSKGPPHFWCPLKIAALVADVPWEPYPAAGLWTKRNRQGELEYGRHSALQTMNQLANADLARFTPATLSHVRAIVAAIKTLSAGNGAR